MVCSDTRERRDIGKKVYKNWANPSLFFCLFSVFSNKQYNFYNKYMWKNVHPVYGAGIWTHDLQNVSLFSSPLDQGSRPDIGKKVRWWKIEVCIYLWSEQWSVLVVGDVGHIGPSRKLLCLCQTPKICSTSMALFHTCLTVRPIQLFISFY